MSKIYRKAEDILQHLVHEVEQKYHQELSELALSYDLLEVYETSSDSPPLMLNGYPCLAVVTIISYKNRVKGMGDAEIVFDAAQFGRLDLDEKKALIDHELTHLEPKRNKEGALVFDDIGRPCLSMRKHDVFVGWFADVAARWGSKSAECRQAKELISDDITRRLYFLGEGPSDPSLAEFAYNLRNLNQPV